MSRSVTSRKTGRVVGELTRETRSYIWFLDATGIERKVSRYGEFEVSQLAEVVPITGRGSADVLAAIREAERVCREVAEVADALDAGTFERPWPQHIANKLRKILRAQQAKANK